VSLRAASRAPIRIVTDAWLQRIPEPTILHAGLLPLPHVQFWETENSWRLDSSHRGSHRRDIPCLVDASDVRTVNLFIQVPQPPA
jgi:hypothetical protein